MCGITAIVSYGAPIPPASLDGAIQTLGHRGPDGHGRWIAANGLAALGHTRLSVIDVSTGVQPIASEDGRYQIVVNGEFYGFERIRSQLQQRGHRFRTGSDSEIALHLYEEKGAACLEDLRGEFAFIIWDGRDREIFAARDRFGIKPLFYAEVANTLYLASEAKALFAAGVPAAWDQAAAFQNLFLCLDQDGSLFEHIRQVPPGHYLRAKRPPVRLHRYWNVDYPRSRREDHHKSRPQWIEELRHSLDEAVSIRLRADVPVGCYLSGGVDSSSVLGIASARGTAPMTAFTVAFEGPGYDESAIAARTAAHLGARFISVPASPALFADLFCEAVSHGEMVHYNAHGVARFALSRAVGRAGYKVVLAGEGADELFAGYDFSSAALAASQSPSSRLRVLRSLLRLMRPGDAHQRQISTVSPALARITKLLALPAPLLENLAGKLVLLRSLLSPEFLHAFGDRDPYWEFFKRFNWRTEIAGRQPVKQVLYLWMKSLFVNYVLAADRLDMSHGVEVRLPFLDHKLFELAKTIPAPLLAQGPIRKQLLRDAVQPFVTEEVFREVKRPFFAPPSSSGPMNNPMFRLMQDLLRGRAFGAVPFFHQASVVELLDRLHLMPAAERAAYDPVLFMMSSICVLQQTHKM